MMEYRRLRLIERFKRTKVYRPGTYNSIPKRLNWEQIEARPSKENKAVVKGTNKRIVVVKSPDPKVFEEAIFVVKEDFLGRRGHADALKEAQEVARDYIRGAVSKSKRNLHFSPLICGLIGALLSTAALLLFYYL